MMRTPVDRLQYLPMTLLSVGIGLAVGMQLSQPRLWPMWTYVLLCLAGLLFILCALLRRLPTWVLLAGAAALAFGSTGWRASHYASRILSADLQGRDIVVQGQIMGLPQWLPSGVRFSFAVDSATLDGQPVALPDTLSLAWYLPRDDAATAAHVNPATAPKEEQAEVTSNSDRCTPCVKPSGQRPHRRHGQPAAGTSADAGSGRDRRQPSSDNSLRCEREQNRRYWQHQPAGRQPDTGTSQR